MAESLLRYQDAESFRCWGRLVGDAPSGASDTLEVAPLITNAQTTRALLNAMSSATVYEEPPIRLPASSLLSPVTRDGQLICQGLNHLDHSAESGHHLRRQNLFFMKASSSLTGPYADIVRPRDVELLDYEVEIGVVMRRPVTEACEVTDETIGDYVAGVVLCNDVSARDAMFGASFLQWFQGKSYRSFCPAGPILLALDPDEVVETLNALDPDHEPLSADHARRDRDAGNRGGGGWSVGAPSPCPRSGYRQAPGLGRIGSTARRRVRHAVRSCRRRDGCTRGSYSRSRKRPDPGRRRNASAPWVQTIRTS